MPEFVSLSGVGQAGCDAIDVENQRQIQSLREEPISSSRTFAELRRQGRSHPAQAHESVEATKATDCDPPLQTEPAITTLETYG
jgi:hypothetical protein